MATKIYSDVQSPVISRRVTTLADLRAITGKVTIQAAQLMGRVSEGDGGEGPFRWDSSDLSTEVTADTQSGIYVAPNSDSTGASGAWVRQHNGIINVMWFGAGTTNDTAIFMHVVETYDHIYFPTGVYTLDNLAFTGLNDKHLTGDGVNATIFDFNLVSSGTAFDISFDAVKGGSQGITIENIEFRDSRDISLVDVMFSFESGLTGQSPAQTSASMVVSNCSIRKYNNSAGIGRNLVNVSHVTFNDWIDGYGVGQGESIVIESTININTGVYNFNNNITRAIVRPVRVTATAQQIDTINFMGGFIGNQTSTDARECIAIDGPGMVTALNFFGVHLECRDDTETACIRVSGQWFGGSLVGNHFSGGTSIKQTAYVILVEGDAGFGSIECMGNEVLRIKSKTDLGAIIYVENTAIMGVNSPVVMGSWIKNTTIPYNYLTEAGGNEDNILKSLHTMRDIYKNTVSGVTRMYELEDSTTPSVEGGERFEITAAYSSIIDDFIDEYKGQLITIVNIAGGDITIAYDYFKIRCKGAVDLTITTDDSVQFIRTSQNHWTQVGEIVSI